MCPSCEPEPVASGNGAANGTSNGNTNGTSNGTAGKYMIAIQADRGMVTDYYMQDTQASLPSRPSRTHTMSDQTHINQLATF